jgi:hypothetical protein
VHVTRVTESSLEGVRPQLLSAMSDSDDLLLPGMLEIVVKTASGDRHVVSIPAEFGLKEIRRRVAGAFAQPGEPEEEGEQDEAEHHVHVDPSSEENKMIVQANKVKEEAPAICRLRILGGPVHSLPVDPDSTVRQLPATVDEFIVSQEAKSGRAFDLSTHMLTVKGEFPLGQKKGNQLGFPTECLDLAVVPNRNNYFAEYTVSIKHYKTQEVTKVEEAEHDKDQRLCVGQQGPRGLRAVWRRWQGVCGGRGLWDDPRIPRHLLLH